MDDSSDGIENALAHPVSTVDVATGYQRGGWFKRRRPLMKAWTGLRAGAEAIAIVAVARNIGVHNRGAQINAGERSERPRTQDHPGSGVGR